MTGRAQAALLTDTGRLHLHHGPIDIIAQAFGPAADIRAAYGQAAARFETVLDELVGELTALRAPLADTRPDLRGRIAQRMVAATWPHRGTFITPMAAVAGAVADTVLAAMVDGRDLDRAYVNNGGDIAIHLNPGTSLSAGIVDDQDNPSLDADVAINYAMPVRGLATSGWRGRSQSLGIADAVTVLAANAATADAAATLIANAVNIDHPAIDRAPATDLRDDTDLADRLVTTSVGHLPAKTIETALVAGATTAERMRQDRLIQCAYLSLRGATRVIDDLRTAGLELAGEPDID